MITLLIAGLSFLKLFSNITRIVLFVSLEIILTILLFYFNLLPILFYFNEITIYIYIATLSMGMFLLIKNFHQTWYAKISLLGKSKDDIAYKKYLQFLLFASMSCNFIFAYWYVISLNIYYLITCCTGFLGSILLINVFKKSHYKKYESFEFFAMTMLTFFSSSIFFVFSWIFFDSMLQDLFFITLVIIVSLLGTIQLLKPGETLRKKMFKKQKIDSLKEILRKQKEEKQKERTFKDDNDIIIINIESDSEKEIIKIPKNARKSRKFAQIKEKTGPIREAKIIIFLAIIMSVFSLIINQTRIILNLPSNFIFYLNFNWTFFNEWLIFSIYLITIMTFILYFSSKKNKKWYRNETTMKNAFLEFLRLIDKEERSILLKEMADTIREIMISGIIDLFGSESESRENLGDTIKEGITFFKRLFTGKDEN